MEEIAEKTEVKNVENAATAPTPSATPTENLIDYDAFSKVQLKVGKIESAERVPKSEKLIKMQINLGETLGTRQILGGLAKFYEPESLIGKQVVVVANLKPAKLMGLESHGMLLAASDDQGNLELLNISEKVNPGGVVK